MAWGGLRPSVCATALVFTLRTSMHCWQAQDCPGGAREDMDRVPLGYATPPFPLELAPDTPTPSSPPVAPPAAPQA